MAQPADKIAVGQLWSVVGSAAKVVVGKIEPLHDITVAHVSAVEVTIPEGAPGAGETTEISHLPFELSSLAASLDRLLDEHATPDDHFADGYASWKEANGGVFTISVDQAIAFVFRALAGGREVSDR